MNPLRLDTGATNGNEDVRNIPRITQGVTGMKGIIIHYNNILLVMVIRKSFIRNILFECASIRIADVAGIY